MKINHAYNLFTYIFTPRTVTGCLLSSSAHTTSIKLHAYYRKSVNHLELEYVHIFNPTRLASLIAPWYHSFKQKIPVVFCLAGPSLHEKIVPNAEINPSYTQLELTHTPSIQWQYTYLYSYDNAHYFYVCGLQKTLLFQYQLFSIMQQLPVQTITSQSMALLSAYRLLFGKAFRPSQLATALSTCNTHVEKLFSKDDLARLLIFPSSFSPTDEDILPLLIACGLFAGERLNL